MGSSGIALTLLPVFWPNMPPLGLAALKGYLAANGVGATCLDFNNYFYSRASLDLQREWAVSCNANLERDILRIMREGYPHEFAMMIDTLLSYPVVGMTCYRSNRECVLSIARLLKEKKPSIKIVLGGPEIARMHFEGADRLASINRDIADLLVVGEGELPLAAFMKEGGRKGTVTFDELEDASEFGIPDYSDLDHDWYPRSSAVPVIGSRGCIRACAFCAERLLYKRYKSYPTEKIIAQIAPYQGKKMRHFVFHDSLINGDLPALESLCDALSNTFGSVSWEAQAAVRNDMPAGLIAKMKASGCRHLFVGLESGADTTLEKMNKSFTGQDAERFFDLLNEAGLSFGVSIITGFPGETEEAFKAGLDFVIRNRHRIPKIEQVNPFVFYDGIGLPKDADYKAREESIRRSRVFIDAIKNAGFKYTKAFMLNLIEKQSRDKP